MSSGTKRKVEELAGQVAAAVVGGVVDWSMSAAVARYESRTSVDEQLDRLRTLSIMVHSAVEAAEGVHIRSWWLRRWLWKLRDAALEGDEVRQLFMQRRAAEETDAANKQAAGNTVWSAACRALRSVKCMLFGRDDDMGIERLSRVVARLEREAMGLGDFLKVLELEIRRSLAVQPEPVPPVPPVLPPPAAFQLDPDRIIRIDTGDLQSFPPPVICMQVIPPTTASADKNSGDRSRLDHGLCAISHEYVAGMRKMGLVIVRQRIRRALDWLLMIGRKPAAPPPASSSPTPETDRIRELAARIQRAIRATTDATALDSHGIEVLDFHGKRPWLSSWSFQLTNVSCRAEYSLLAVSRSGGDGDVVVASHDVVTDGRIRRAAQNVEMAVAHLEDFVTLAGFAVASLG